ncbi:MAG: YunC family protein, partial [Desulfurococcus sp.]|uniref:YunC family protein n=1 Tax=Desulfurococcus sp. TaxID=51678 RepID=UPI003D0DC22B
MMSVSDFIRIREVNVEGKKLIGIEISLPNSPPAVILIGEKGFAMCGLLDVQAAERLGVVAVKVQGVRTVEDMLAKEISDSTSKARERGLVKGVKLIDVINKL